MLNVFLSPNRAHTMNFFSCSDYGYTIEKDNGWKHLLYRSTIYKKKCFDEMETLKNYVYCSARLKQANLKLRKNSSSPQCWFIFSQCQEKATLTFEI